MYKFMPGLKLSQSYYWEVVRPLLDQYYPGLRHAAALIGPGSEVLGFDTEMSMDHHWFPNVQIFLRESDKGLSSQIHETLRWKLPSAFMDFPLNLEEIPDEPGIYLMVRKDAPPIEHNIYPLSVGDFKTRHLNWSDDQTLTASDWLSVPTQILRSITSGAVHFDNVGELSKLRRQLEWYPHDVWLYLLAAGWHRIGDQEHLMPRAGYVGDELGSALISSQLTRDIMFLCFLMEKEYAPYPKWFGSAFQLLECAGALSPILHRIISAESWSQREAALSDAYQILAAMHNKLGITKPLPGEVSSFHGRPFMVIHGDRFGEAILSQIQDQDVLRISQLTMSGSIDQISDNTKFLSDHNMYSAVSQIYRDQHIPGSTEK